MQKSASISSFFLISPFVDISVEYNHSQELLANIHTYIDVRLPASNKLLLDIVW